MASNPNGGGAWSYAVPLEETDGNARHYPQQRPEPTDTLQKRNSAWDLMSDSETTKIRRTSLRATNASAGRKRSRNQLRDKQRPPEDRRSDNVDDSAWIHRDKLAQIEIQEMQEAGIPVRKLRRPESAGPVQDPQDDGRASRSVSRTDARRAASRTSHDRQHDSNHDAHHDSSYPSRDHSPRKRISTVPSAPEHDPDPTSTQEPTRTYEANQRYEEPELEPEPEPKRFDQTFEPAHIPDFPVPADPVVEQHPHKHQTTRPSTSRIPVSRVSPVPVPQTVVDRDSPLPRSRAGSQNWSGSFDEMQYARKARSGSVSSQVLLDSDPDAMRITPPGSSNKTSSNDENSPPKSKVPRKTGPSGRKASAASTVTPRPGSSHQNNKRAASASAKRPGSSSGYNGHKSRPSTGHYPPEGEAPWIATMYKPDPRLPPEQQMLPTHAKRMMQEQWEREGKTGTIYDRDFKLLNDEELPKPKAPVLSLESQSLEAPQRSPSPPKKDRPSPNGSANGGPWPLSPTKSDNRSDNGSGRPGTSGGYKITPTIAQTPTMQRSAAPSPVPPPSMPAHNPTPRVPDLDEKQEAAPKKGCCCIVM